MIEPGAILALDIEKPAAGGRMLARHKTSYEQLVTAVAPATRNAYCVLVGQEIR